MHWLGLDDSTNYPSQFKINDGLDAAIKSIHPNHLVIDGKAGIDSNVASLTNVDMVFDHCYPKSVVDLKSDAALAKKSEKFFMLESITAHHSRNNI